MPSKLLSYKKNSSHVTGMAHVRNTLNPGYLTAATVTSTFVDTGTGLPLTGETWPVTCAYVTGSEGVYRATLPHALAVTVGQRLTETLTVVSGTLQRVYTRHFLVED